MVESTSKDHWIVTPLKDERTGDLSYEFTFPVGDGTTGSREIGAGVSVRTMANNLARRTTTLPTDKKARERFVHELLDAAPIEFVAKARQPGFKLSDGNKKPEAFVTPGQIIGPGSSRYSSVPLKKPHLGQVAGDYAAWSASTGRFVEHSSFIAFTIMTGLAGPLLQFVNLPEDPAFNLSGRSSGGKTGAARAGASTVGHPDAISHWATTERRLEEVAAAHNHSMLVLNAAEKAAPKRRLQILTDIVHMVTEGQSTGRSEAVQDRFPDLMWRTLVLSTSNKTGAEMAKELGWAWDV
jgi:hypothetical protein